MNITVEKLPDCKVKLNVEVPESEVSAERNMIVASFRAQAKVPGFRPGKIPLSVVEKRFGKSIDGELQERLVRNAMGQAQDKEGVNLIGIDKVSEQTFQTDKSYTFIAEVVTAPEVDTIPDYSEIAVEVPKNEIGEENIDNVIEDMRKRGATHGDLEGRPVAFGDIAIVNYKASIDGTPLNEAVTEDVGALAESDEYWIKVDKDSFLPGFCEKLEGMEIDEKRDITVSFPDDFPVEELREKEATFAVELTGMKEEVLPEINDEFAATLAPGKTMEEIRELIKENLQQQAEQQRQQIIDNQILHHVSKESEFDLPSHIVQDETQRQVNAMVQEIQQQGMDPNAIAENSENLIDTASQRAETNVRTNYILQKIAEQEKIEVTNDDLNQEVSMMAYQSGRPPKKVVQEIQKNNGVPEIQNRIMIRKTLEVLRANATITEVDPPAAEESEDAK